MFVMNPGTVIMALMIYLVTGSESNEGCWTGQLQSVNDSSPPLGLKETLALQVFPDKHVKVLSMQLLLEDEAEQPLYSLELNADMHVKLHDVNVTLKEVNSGTDVLKVFWPPVFLPQAWTTIFIRLPYQYLFQVSVIPKHQHQVSRSPMSSHVRLKPVAVSARLRHRGVTRLKLQLVTDTFMKYTVNCDKDYLASYFASEFGIASSTPIWRSCTLILIGLVILQLFVIIILAMKTSVKAKKWSPSSFIKTQFMSGSSGDDPSGNSSQAADQHPSVQNTSRLQPLNVTVGVVSSRAPSPGQEIDETTFDYINKAYTNE